MAAGAFGRFFFVLENFNYVLQFSEYAQGENSHLCRYPHGCSFVSCFTCLYNMDKIVYPSLVVIKHIKTVVYFVLQSFINTAKVPTQFYLILRFTRTAGRWIPKYSFFCVVEPFHATGPFLYLLKALENLRFSNVLRVCKETRAMD